MSIAEKFEVIADAVYDKGKQAEYDKFWDAFQQNGKRNNYSYGIGGLGWTVDNFKPKYDMKNLLNATFMFCNSGIRASLTDILDECGVEWSLTGCSSITYCFRTSQFTELPTVDGSSATSWNYLFADMTYLKTIQKLVFPSSTTATTLSNAFYRTSALENINEIEGTISSSISFLDSTLLSADTLVNIIKHLEDFSGTSDEGTKILTIHGAAFERLNVTYTTPEEVGIPFFGSWLSYIESLGWHM